MADARRERGSVFGCEGFGPDQLRFHVAAPRLAGIAADGIHSRNARGEDDAAAGETQAADPGRPGIAVTRANEAMMRAVAAFVGRAVRGATPRHYRPAAGSGRRRLPRPVARWRGIR